MTDATTMLHAPGALEQLQSLDLDAKVALSRRRIRAWYERWDGQVYVSVSGGLDSTVLAHIVRGTYPDVPRVFFDTGLEYPENRAQACEMGAAFVRPDKTFVQVIEQYGYPVISKRVSQCVHEARTSSPDSPIYRLRTTGIKPDGTFSKLARIPEKWMFLLEAPFAISHRCCHWLKKRPGAQHTKRTGRYPLIGVRAEEGQQRSLTWREHGCNAWKIKHPRSWPLAFWTDADIRDYLTAENVPYSRLYDMGYTRSGCMFCMFGIHMEKHPNRFDRMQETHPKQYRFCVDKLGIGRVLDYLFDRNKPLLTAAADTEAPLFTTGETQ